ncbi:MAG: cytochrome c maturation protein CcmE [Armatimonadetes bacterium]|nr:cytochrome c maturation protein CcmE [Armatimonadota bacterium]
MKPGAIIAAVLAIAGLGLGVYAFMANASPYVSAKDAAKRSGETVHVAGKIDHASARASIQNELFEFTLIDDHGDTLPVTYKGMKPGNFDTAPTASVQGRYEGGKFHAAKITTQCPSKYETEEENYLPQPK